MKEIQHIIAIVLINDLRDEFARVRIKLDRFVQIRCQLDVVKGHRKSKRSKYQ